MAASIWTWTRWSSRGSRSSRTASAARNSGSRRSSTRMRPVETGEPATPAAWVDEQRSPGSSAAAGPPLKPRLLRALRSGLRAAYDYLGTVLVASAVWIAAAVVLGTGGSELMALAAQRHRAALPLLSAIGGVVAAGIGTGPLTVALFEHV